jgi:hypothetical protein
LTPASGGTMLGILPYPEMTQEDADAAEGRLRAVARRHREAAGLRRRLRSGGS